MKVSDLLENLEDLERLGLGDVELEVTGLYGSKTLEIFEVYYDTGADHVVIETDLCSG